MVITKSRINDGYQSINEIRRIIDVLMLDEFPPGFDMNRAIQIIKNSTDKLNFLFSQMEIELECVFSTK